MENTIAKSPEMLQREAEVKDLKAQLKKRQTTLKSLKTRLKNMQDEVSKIQRDVHVQMFHKMETLDKLRMEIAALANQLKKMKGLSREDKQQLSIMADDLAGEGMFGAGFEEYKSQKQKMESGNFNFDENERARMRDIFESFKTPLKETDQKEIRKVYVKLSQKFHPDLSRGDKEAAQFHDLMQQINEAYQNNDIQTLLELDSLFSSDSLDFETKAITVDVLKAETERLKRDLALIEKQMDRTSDEIKNIRDSELGKILTAVGKAERDGQGFDAMGEQMDASIEMFSKLKEGLEDSIRLGSISPKLIQLSMQGDGLEDEDFGGMSPLNILMRMAEGDESAFDFFSGLDDDEEEIVENPKFPIGSSVQVSKSVKLPGHHKLDMKGWTGRVESAWYAESRKVVYDVSFDSITMSQMPADFIRYCVDEVEDFQDFEVMEAYLQACPARDTQEETTIAYRRLLHQWNWNYLGNPAQIARMKAILLAQPANSDRENWEFHLTEKLAFPFEAKAIGRFGISKQQTVMALAPAGFDEEIGHTVVIKLDGKRQNTEYPLQDLRAKDKKNAASEVLMDYATWAENYFAV